MKLLVFAQTPPPVHGQSVMVRTLVDGLGGAARARGTEIKVVHVNPALSRDAADVGRVRIGKIFALWAACWRALRARWRGRGAGGMTLYYVPAPGKRPAVWRDLMVMFALRPFFTRLVLHWHAVGLGAWLENKARAPERWLARLALGRADIAIVLAPELADDAMEFAPRRVCVVPNGIDVFASQKQGAEPARVICRLLFLGLCGREKGVFAALDAMAVLERETPGAFELVVAGAFASEEEEREFNARLATDNAGLRKCVRYAGPADDAEKHALYDGADMFVFPTHYAHEAQPLVLIEAMAHDLPVVTTHWRAIPGMLPECPHAQVVGAHASAEKLASAIRDARAAGPVNGIMRAHYEKHFTRSKHLATLVSALRKTEE
ncbi:glycosyltransferase involved in cell wall biosynthesis [Ereboglobus sp. PH5-10]|uniref:glycosyltransferase family 4 protein n=1 Tax=Ereboglobus sp. PH5-10 TaxID=2940629 RepID=UPI0024075C68|nr:glycosyltransferase family 4 protein [Ereboglobus sp. PH5-10]MDF9827678.1 glycosyltransferase involved in cell wall biosynthesis [Ereboglobus sp. PH5-10]